MQHVRHLETRGFGPAGLSTTSEACGNEQTIVVGRQHNSLVCSRVPHVVAFPPPTMTQNSTGGPSIFSEGKLKPGIYKIQNIYTDTYLDIEVHSREVCCRPAKDLGEGRGLWEIKQFGAGYTVQRFEPGKPDQFCTPLKGFQDMTTLRVGAYPVAWRVEIVNDDNHRGFEYVRFYWGTERITWDLPGAGNEGDGVKVVTHHETEDTPWQVWNLTPMKVEGGSAPPRSSLETPEPGSLPPYGGDTAQPSTHAQHVESERDEFGTVVNEVTVVTTTVTTRKRYRVEDV